MNKAYRYRIYPTAEQEVLIRKTFGCVRFLYNQMLAERKNKNESPPDDEEHRGKTRYRTPAGYKQEYEWLREVDSLALCNAELNLKKAFANFYRNKCFGYPKFKSRKDANQSYTTNNQKGTIRFEENGKFVRLPKLGDIRIKLHRQIPDNHTIKSATISLGPTGKYHISLLTPYTSDIPTLILAPEKLLGLDYSSPSLYVTHNGEAPDYPGYIRKMEARLKKEQRALSGRKKGGSNREKQRRRVALLHEKVANQRNDFLHKESRKLAEAWDAIAIGDLNMKEMSQTLSLGKSTMDNGNGLFRTFLAYKLAEQGKSLIRVDKWFPSSKLCRHCGTIHSELTLKDRIWTCGCCGITHERDINAANNIRVEGLRMLSLA